MQSRRDARPTVMGVGGQHLPEMHVSMKVNIVSDGPGGISFSQAVNTPAGYNGLYDYSHLPVDQQQQHAIGYPKSSMLPWPVDSSLQKQEPSQTEPVVQMPDTSQENVLESNAPVGTVAVQTVQASDNEAEKKPRRHHHRKHRHQKDGDNQSVTRSQSASSLVASVKTSEVTVEKKHRRSKHKSTSGAGGDESSSTSRRSNGERSSARASSAKASSRKERPVPPERRSLHSDQIAAMLSPLPQPNGHSSRSAEPLVIVEGRKLDELLSEVIINTFADEETNRDSRLVTPKVNFGLGQQEPTRLSGSSPNRSLETEDDGIRVKAMDSISIRRLLSSTNGQSGNGKYPVPVDTPVVPKVTATTGVQADEPFLSDRGIQTEDLKLEEKKKKKKEKVKTPSEVQIEAPPVQDYLRHIVEATAGLIEASRVVLEQRAQTPQLFVSPIPEAEAVMPQQPQARVPKETLIDDPAIPPLSGDNDPAYRGTPAHDTSFERRARTTPGPDASQGQRQSPGFDASHDKRGQTGHGLDPSHDRRGGTVSAHANTSRGNADRSFERPSHHGHHHHHHHYHDHEQQYEQAQDHPGAAPGVYYMHTYCAICGSPRTTRPAVSGGAISPTQEYLQSTAATAAPESGGGPFLANTRPSGEDEIEQSPPRRPQHAPPAPPLLPPPPPPPQFDKRNTNDRVEEKTVTFVRELEEIYYQTDEKASPYGYHHSYEETQVSTSEKEVYGQQERQNDPTSNQWLDRSLDGSEPPQPLPKDYMDHNGSSVSSTNESAGDPRIFSLSFAEPEVTGIAPDGYSEDEKKSDSSGYLKPDADITAAARARLQELQLLACDTSPQIQIGRPLQMFSPGSSVVTRSTGTSAEHSRTQDQAQQNFMPESVTSVITHALKSEKIPNGHAVVDRPSPPPVDLREALEQRRIQLARQRETFFGPVQPPRYEDPELIALYERNAVYVPPLTDQQPKLNIQGSDYDHEGKRRYQETIPYPEAQGIDENSRRTMGAPPSRKTVQFDEDRNVKKETVTTTFLAKTPTREVDRSREYRVPEQPLTELTVQPYADYVTQNRLMPSAKIFQLHMRGAASTSGGTIGEYAKRTPEQVPAFDPSNLSVTSEESGTSISRRALAGSGGRTIDDGISSVGSMPRSTPYGDTGSEHLSDYGQDRFTPTPTMQPDEDGTMSKDSVASMTSYRAEQTRMYYGGDTLSSTASGGSAQPQKRANDLYRKALLSQQQGRKEVASRASSINSERSSVSGAMRERGGGAFTTAEVDRYLDDNLSDYAQDRFTPIDEDWAVPGSRASDTGTRSHDSLASETSYRADTSHDFYGTSATPDQKGASSRSPSYRPPSRQPPSVTVPEKSFADIMRERSAARNARLLFYTGFGNPPPLDRIEEHEQEVAFSKGRASSTLTTESDRTMTATDSIEREGSGIYAVRPSIGKLQSSTKRSALLSAAVLGRDDAGSSSIVGSELENIDDYSQGRISPMMDIGNDRTATISSYGELTRDTIRTAQLVNREYRNDPDDSGFVGYGKAKEKVISEHCREASLSSSSDKDVEPKRFRQTDL